MKRPFARQLIRAACLVAALLPGFSPGARADTVHAAVAANFSPAIKALAPLFELATGYRLAPSFGASGQLYAQITQGAPFDLLLSADEAIPRKLIDDGLAAADSYRVYARGRLVLWSPRQGVVDAEGAVLKSAGFSRLAIANPKTSPYGQAAMEALESLGLLERVRSRFVTGENIGQAAQFVASGNVPLGFIALSQVMARPPVERGSYWLVPVELHRPIDQAGVVLAGADSAAGARVLLDFLRSPQAVTIIRQLGYEIPVSAP